MTTLDLLVNANANDWSSPMQMGGQVRAITHVEGFIEIRARLRSYLGHYLIRKIVLEHNGIPPLRDAYFAGDLGL